MRSKALFCTILLAYCSHAAPRVRAKEKQPTSWAFVRSGPTEVRHTPSKRKRAVAQLGRGALVQVYETTSKGPGRWSQVRMVDLDTFTPRMGWVDSSDIQNVPLDQFPTDIELLKQLGGEYLDDFVSSHIEVARFLVRQGGQESALACILGSPKLPHSRLQIFRRLQGKFAADIFSEFPYSEIKAGITAMEVLDLVGDGNECLVTHEPFDLSLEVRGMNLVIRRIGGGQFEKLWEAPLEYRNLASFPPRLQILKPPDKNIGAPGTVTTGTVNFIGRGVVREPVWKGKIEFHAFGREEPVESVSFEKVCAWDGEKFAPLK